jgi:hypothetical protein
VVEQVGEKRLKDYGRVMGTPANMALHRIAAQLRF